MAVPLSAVICVTAPVSVLVMVKLTMPSVLGSTEADRVSWVPETGVVTVLSSSCGTVTIVSFALSA